jgi:hypothetical protein
LQIKTDRGLPQADATPSHNLLAGHQITGAHSDESVDNQFSGGMNVVSFRTLAVHVDTKKYWLVPMMFMMILFGGLVVLTQGSVIAPMIYTLF